MLETKNPARLGHLEMLEAESIEVLREAVSEFQNPVMLYSIGKDSSVMLRLAQKAFYPGPIPFPLLHVDTTYKFREMIEFRDQYTAQIGARLIVTPTRRRLRKARSPSSSARSAAAGCSRPSRCSTRWRRVDSTRRSAAPGATKSGRVPRNGSS